jgi:threonine dehydratase
VRLPNVTEIEEACRLVYESMSPTPQYAWPLLSARLGAEVWVKHENHTRMGAFKIRGGLVYFRQLNRDARTVITATRGNHGQAVAYAASRENRNAIVYVPRGNSTSKNLAMQSLGAELVEFGEDFEEARREACRRAAEEGLHYVPSFHELLARGAATYSLELLSAVSGIDTAYVPIGLGSGISGMCAAREALGRSTEIVGVVAAGAPAYLESFLAHKAVERPVSTRLADGLACSAPNEEALDVILRHVARVIAVTDDEIADAMRVLFDDTHNVAEGAGAAALAGAIKERRQIQGKRIAVVLTGGNVDRDVFGAVLTARVAD